MDEWKKIALFFFVLSHLVIIWFSVFTFYYIQILDILLTDINV